MKFKVGDVVVTKFCKSDHGPLSLHRGNPNACTPPQNIGLECTIVAIDPDDPYLSYMTDLPRDHCWGCENCFDLKQKPIEREQTGEWELCPWQPKPVTVGAD